MNEYMNDGFFRACCINGSRIQEHQPNCDFLLTFLEIGHEVITSQYCIERSRRVHYLKETTRGNASTLIDGVLELLSDAPVSPFTEFF